VRRRGEGPREKAARLCALVLALCFLSGCPVGPNYKRPETTVPETFRNQTGAADVTSLADLPWWQVFEDETLQGLIHEALENNYNLLTAAARVEQARAQVGVTRSQIYPQAGYQAQASRGKQFGVSPENSTFNTFLAAFNVAWDLDIWGRIRRASEASLADLLATEWVRRGVVLTLVSDVAIAYFQLRELDLELEIAQRTTKSFQDSLTLFEQRYRGGVGNKLATERAAAALAQTAAAIPSLENQIVATENLISILVGRFPGPIPRGAALVEQRFPVKTPPGLPSTLLERRPDIQQAEENMVATNALVGVAVANFFPRVGLTSVLGGQSEEIENIVKNSGAIWLIAGQLAGPLFQGGLLIESYRAQVAQWEQAKMQYAQTILTALQEVSDALTAQQKLAEVRDQQALAVAALQESVRLATLRYVGGLATYFEVLEAQQQLFPAENFLAQTERDQLITVVQLYKALGGGWTTDHFEPPSWVDFARLNGGSQPTGQSSRSTDRPLATQ
jgi:multidrug efflux system outer membrane protein